MVLDQEKNGPNQATHRQDDGQDRREKEKATLGEVSAAEDHRVYQRTRGSSNPAICPRWHDICCNLFGVPKKAIATVYRRSRGLFVVGEKTLHCPLLESFVKESNYPFVV